MTATETDTDISIVVRFVDECLADLGTQGLIDGDKARDQLLDIRRLLTSTAVEETPDDN